VSSSAVTILESDIWGTEPANLGHNLEFRESFVFAWGRVGGLRPARRSVYPGTMRDFRHELAACLVGCSVPSRMMSSEVPCSQLVLVLIQPEDFAFQFSAFGTAFSVVFVRVDRASS